MATKTAREILSDEEILARRDRNSFDGGYQAGVECHAELRTELLEALMALRTFMWSEGYADQNMPMAKADAVIRKATHE